MARYRGILARRQFALDARESFDGDDVRPIQLEHPLDAGVDRVIIEAVAGRAANEHGARAAIALGANDLGARESEPPAQEVAQAEEAVVAGELMPAAVDVEQQVFAHGQSRGAARRQLDSSTTGQTG